MKCNLATRVLYLCESRGWSVVVVVVGGVVGGWISFVVPFHNFIAFAVSFSFTWEFVRNTLHIALYKARPPQPP